MRRGATSCISFPAPKTFELIWTAAHQPRTGWQPQEEELALKITEAIRNAETEYVIYFLLSAYVESLEHSDILECTLSAEIKRLPITGVADISRRAHVLAAEIGKCSHGQARPFIEEVVDVFGVALQRLRHLLGPRPVVYS